MKVTVPRCFDHHDHFSLYLALQSCPDISGARSAGEAFSAISCLRPDKPNLVRGWKSWQFDIRPCDLEGLVPVVVINYCLHGYVMNRAAASMAADAGFNLLPADTGSAADAAMFFEKNMPGVLAFFGSFQKPRPGDADRLAARLRSQGIYGVEDMLWVGGTDEVFVPGAADGSVSTDSASDSRFVLKRWAAAGESSDPVLPPGFCGFKLFADGAVGSGTAAIGSGTVGHWNPVLTHTTEELAGRIAACMATGAAVSVHAIGDVAIDQVLDAVESLTVDTSKVRIEHVQFITFRQAMRAREMGISLCMQPNFNDDSVAYADRLSPDVRALNNPFRMLIDDAGFVPGKDLLFGSDGMPSGIVEAVRSSLFPAYASQTLTLDELLAGYGADCRKGTVDLEIDCDARTVVMCDSAGVRRG